MRTQYITQKPITGPEEWLRGERSLLPSLGAGFSTCEPHGAERIELTPSDFHKQARTRTHTHTLNIVWLVKSNKLYDPLQHRFLDYVNTLQLYKRLSEGAHTGERAHWTFLHISLQSPMTIIISKCLPYISAQTRIRRLHVLL